MEMPPKKRIIGIILESLIFVVVVLLLVSLFWLAMVDDLSPTGQLKFQENRLYCNNIISTGWTYTFNYLVPQEELNKICEMEMNRE